MRKIISFLCIFFILSNVFSDYGYLIVRAAGADNISIQSTNVWVDKNKVEFGEVIKIHYSFNDEPHPVSIDIYQDQTWRSRSIVWSTYMSNTYEYTAAGEGVYKFVITPLDNASSYIGDCSVKVYKHRVILIPGIMASELYDGNDKVWIPSSNPLTAAGKVDKLKMKTTGEEIIKLRAGSPEPEYYESLHKYLDKNFYVVDFGYDWRLGAEHNAGLLKKVIDDEKASSPDSKVYIVAHSMGGIVATEYINLGYGRNVDKLITLGTPYLGAPKASYIFETGNATGVAINDLVIGRAIGNIMPNILSAYELLPSKKYFSLNNTYYLSHSVYLGPSFTRRSNFKTVKYPDYESTKGYLKTTKWANDSMIEKAEVFHDKLDILNNLNSVESYYVIGDKIATLGGMTLYGTYDQPVRDIKTIQGDGTVPVISASVGNKLVQSKTYYIQEEHSKLPGNSSVQKQVENILLGNSSKLAPNIRRFTEATKTLKLKVESPVDLNVYDSLGNHLGSNGTTSYEETIPFGSYYTDGETKIALLNDGDYNVKLKGNGYGDMVYSLVWSNEKDEEEKTVRFDNVNVTPNSIFTSGTNENGKITLQVDENGDGTVDYTMPPSVELDSEGTQDETIPTISSIIEGVKGVNDWYGKGVYYNLTGKDSESGVYKTFYDLNDSGSKEYTSPIQLPNTGIYNFKSFVRDKNRNDSEILTETVKVDTTNPTVPNMTIEPIKWTNQFVTITFSGSEDADSGFQKYQYKIEYDGNWKDYTTPIIIDKEGLHNIYARAVDNVFNLSDEVSGEAKVDKTNPSMPEGLDIFLLRSNKIGISWFATDNVGVTGYDLYVNSKFVGSTTETKFVFENLISNKNYTFKVVARDEAGNYSPDGLYVVQTPIGLATGENHSLQIHEDRTLWAWGKNDVGQLGDGTKTSKTTAIQVVELSGVISVAAGSQHSLALKSDGTVWGWGNNSVGQVGNGGSVYQTYSKPEQVKNLTGIIAIAAKANSSYALKNDGTVWSWGNNTNGQLGDNTSTNRSVPVQVVGVSGVSQLAAGSNYAYALKTDGTVWGWGYGSALLGGSGTNSKANLMPGLTGIASIAATSGSSTGLALKKDGSVGVWNSTSFTPVSGLSNIEAIAGGSSNYAMGADGSVWNWTNGAPTKAAGLSDISAIAMGTNYTVFSKTDGSIWSWGSINSDGQLGDGTTVAHTPPALVKENVAPKVTLTYPVGTKGAPEETNVSNPSIRWTQDDAALTNFSAYEVQVLDASGTVVVDSGVVDQPVTSVANAWTVTQPLAAGQAFQVRVKVYDEQLWSEWSAMGWLKVKDGTQQKQSQLATGDNHTLRVKADGSVWAWGKNDVGQLGDGTKTSKTTAVQVVELSGVISVAAGSQHSLALKSDGTVWGWGYNSVGQVGNGGTLYQTYSKPEQVKNLTGIIAIAAKANSSYALKNDGTVWSWGNNTNGQLGDNTSTNRSVPVQVVGVSGVSQLAAGSNYAYALKTDGTVWGWGYGSALLGGSGTNSKANLMPGLTGIASIAATSGSSTGLALKKDGSVGVWNSTSFTPVSGLSSIEAIAGGSSNYAMGADGSVWNWTNGAPTKAAGLSDISAIAMGTNYTVFSKTDGSIWSWGSINSDGQLGDGTTVAHTLPALVKENVAPKVTLTYPVGTKGAPEETNVSNPSIRWTQDDAALTNFSAYEVQVLDASGTVVVDSGVVDQPVTSVANAWTVTQLLPAGQAFQVRVKVYDEQLWSEWSAMGWLKVKDGTQQKQSQLATGDNHTLRVKADGSVWAWGKNDVGQLGDGTKTSKTTAVQVVELSGVISVAAGSQHSLALKSDGTVWGWGYNSVGQVGNGGTLYQTYSKPEQVKNLTGIIAIAAKANSSYALKNDGTVWSWGNNTNGQLGDNTSTNRSVPVQVVGVSGVSQLAAGSNYAYALKTDGTVWGWGYGSALLGGSGTNSKANLMPGLTGIASIAATSGSSTGLALKKDGSVGVWNSTSFTPVSGLSNIEAIAGGSSNYAMGADGSVWNWTNGAPTKAAGLSDISAIAMGTNYTVFSKTDGSIWSWGSINSDGQLGDGTTVAHTPPALVKENVAPKVTLTYPVGTKGAPEETNVSNPSIRWTQDDAALTNFSAYEVQVLDASGTVVVDSGVVDQPVTSVANAWTVTQPLAAGQAFQVRVKVYDEQLWSEWSAMGWLKVKDGTQQKQSQLATGDNHTLRVKADGSVWAWGKNDVGQLGDGTKTSKTTAVQVVELSGVISVAAGSQHSLALKSDGTVWGWGYNSVGQVGNGGTLYQTYSKPEQVKNLTGIIAIAAKANSSYALKNDGTVWSWGNNTNGQLGDNTSTNRSVPVQVVGVSGVSQLAAGSNYAYALKTDGTVWGWGYGSALLGGSGTNSKANLMPGLTGIASIAATSGSSTGLALKKDGSVGVWNSTSFTPVSGLSSIEAIAGGSSNYAMGADGSVWNWTNGAPTKAAGLSDISAIAMGTNYTVFSKTDGSIWSWGSINSDGQLGDGTTVAHTLPALVKENVAPKVTLTYPVGTKGAPEETNVSNPSIRWTQDDAALTNFSAYEVQVLDASGTVVVDSGVVDQPVTSVANAWTVTQLLPAGQAFQVRVKVYDEQLWSEWSAMGWLKVKDGTQQKQSQLATGDNHTLRVKADGSVWAWGKNDVGQLGDGTKTSKTTAVQVVELSGVISVAAGSQHSLALKSDGTVWGWGYNSVGQVGNGGTLYQTYSKPEQVKNLTGIIAIAAKANSSYALKNDGTVWSWGNNTNGQLGDNTSTNRSVPVQVVGVSGVSQLAAGSNYAYALKTDGTVWGWGYGSALLGGSGTNSKANLMPGLTGIASIAATSGSSTGLALKKDGSVGVWNSTSFTPVSGLSNIEAIAGGSSNYAMGADGSVWNWTNGAPTKAAGLSDISAIAMGTNYTVFSKTDGSIWSWGSINSDGQLGDGTTVAHTPPALVKENVAPKVTLTYPVGTKGAPEETNVSNPSIRWTQDDAALTNFSAYEVQVLDASGTVVVDSGVVDQPVTSVANAWTVTQPLAAGQAFQVRVKVYDEQLWSEWSAMGWLKVKDGTQQKQSQLATGDNHTLRVKADGSVWAWGKNDVGQLGDGTKTSKTTAVQVVELSGVISVAAGSQHSLALKSDGTVWGWGNNSVGQVGNGGSVYQTYSKPEQVKNLTGIIAIAAKANSSYALKNDGTVWSWGNNSNGQLGDSSTTNRSVPVQVVGVSGVSQLAAGSNYAYALKTDGTVWGWGYGSALLGGSGTNSKANLMPGLTGIASIAATSGSSTGLALKKDGSVGVWNSTSFTPVSGLSSIEAIAGGSSNYAMGADGSVWNWTNGAPTKAAGLSDISAIAMGTNYTVFSKTDGSIWSWGSINSDGQLGDGTTVAHTLPALVKENVAPKVTLTYPLGTKGAPEETNVSNPSIRWTQDDAALTNFSAYEVQVLDASGTVVVDSGVVDQPVTSVANAWTVTQLLPAGQAFQVRVKVYDEQLWSEWSAMGWLKVKDGTQQKQSQLATGDNHTLRVKADGSVWAWGKNDVGQLGDGTKTSKTTAVQVVELSGVISVAAGSQHSLALKSDGTVWGWGNNSVGQVGNGGTLYQTYSKPEQVKNLTGIIAIAAKANSSYALKNDGTVWSWGNNSNGQLGDNTSTNRSVPVQVVGVSGVSQLAAGSNYAYALKTDGTVWGWGYGSALLGGSGTNSKANLMPGLTGIASIAATSGSSTGLALKKDGSVGVWNSTSFTPVSGLSSIEAIAGGSSNYAMGADGSVWNWTNGAPTKAAGLSDISAIAMGTNYTVFSKTDGSIWSWGSINSDGQLGDGTTVAHTPPALVKENVAPKVTLTYPVGTKGAPEETNVSNPSIRWTQDDAALTNFSAYEVQVLDASGTVVVDSGVVDQPVTSVANAWTVTQLLPAGQAFQVRVKVYDEQLWSEWSAMGWLKVKDGTQQKQSQLATGDNHTLRVKADGSVWAWGKNDVGQLGDGTKTSKTTAIQVVELSGVISVAAGSQHSLALKSDGTVWGWGNNSVGQVGNGGSVYQTYSKPEQVKNLTGIIAIAAKANSSYALKNDGTVWSWGNNTNGQLGDNTSTNRSVPVQVVGVSGVSQLAAGSNYAYALKTDGTVWGWGYGSALLGGSGTNSKANLMPGLTGIASIAATSGSSTGLALKKDGSVGVWNSTSFTPVSGLSSIEAIAGGSSNYAMGADGSVWNWTNGAPTKAAGLSDISAIAMGTNYTVFSKTDGSIWSWGSINSDGQLGDGTTVAHTLPALVKENVAPKVTLTYPLGTKGAPEETNVSNPSIRWTQDDAALTNFSAYEVQVLDASGTVVVDSGVVDQPVTSVANAWTVTQLLPAGQAFQVRVKVYDEQLWSEWSAMGWLKVKDGTQQKQSQLATGDNHTLRVKADGSVWAWGKNDVGQLGDGTKTSKTTAVQVVELSGVISVAAGSQHSLALKSDGTVWGWGNNSVGQVGNGGSVYQTYSKPEQVKNLTGIIAIAAKANSSYALKNDGTVWSWGNNSNGQLGDSTSTNRSVPVQVVGVSGVSQLAAGSNYAYALTSAGTVWGWGYGYTSKAILMPGLTGIASIAATSGSSTGLALKKDGSVGVWNSTSFTPVSGLSNIEAIAGGSSNYAMSADGSVWNWTNGAPTKAAGLSDISAIAMGTNYTVFSKTDGSIWSWGSINSDGQLGDGTTVAHTPPALVKENVAPKVTLTYPVGTKGAPEETNVSNPSIRWTQDDAALTNFSAYEVQVLDASGTVVVDSGVVDQPVTSVANAWTVTQLLPAGQAFQVRVKVYDEQLWSEWSAMGWLKVKDGTQQKQSQLATGDNHTLRVKADGSVWAWGKNDVGQLGDGTKTSKTTAIQVVELSGVISVAAGSQHSLALKSDGTVWGWGNNSVGQVGNGGSVYQTYSKPEQVKNLTGIIAIAAKANSSYALKNDGTVWSWGNNTNGQLGDNTSTNRSVPVQVVGVSGVSQLAAGSNYAYALTSAGTVWGWGYGYTSKAILMPGLTSIASIAATSGSSTGLALKKDGSVGVWNSTSFTPVSGLSNIEAIAGGSSNYAMGADGSVWNWTNGAPTKAAGLSDISAIAMGTNYTVFSKTDGSIWSWGSINSDGQLGDGTTVAHTPPALVKENVAPKVTLTYPVGTKGAPEETNVSNPSIRWTQDDAALTNFSAYEVQVLDASGTVVVDSGVVDQPVTSVANAWTVTQPLAAGQAFQVRVKVYDEQLWSEWSAMGWLKVKDGTQQKQSQLATGDNHTLRVKADGSVWAWGKNDVGQLGDGTKTSKTTAVQVVELSGVISVAAGSQHSLALKSDGTVWGWGNNSVGQVGNGGTLYQTYSKPEQVKNLTGIIAIAAKANSSYALKNDGTVWSWGNNTNGQLGDNTSTNRSVPVQVVGVSGVSQLAAGSNYAYALKTDGTVWGWGYGSALLGGSGTNSKANLMPGLTGIASIAATSGSSTGLALKKDGSVGVWNSTSFTPVSGLSSIEAIAGGSSNYAMGADGSVWNWTNGAPTKAAGLSDISAIAMGTNYTVFSKTDGSIWSWGSINSDGQLGDGTTVAHTLPALVKENVAPKVTLTYPLGTKGAPEETNVSNPSIRWTQDDAALTNFSAYEVQVLDASGTVVVDSGVVDQPVTSVANAWTVTQLLPAGQAFQVRVKVYDEQLWSEWSAMGWLKVKDGTQQKQSQLATGDNHTLRVKADGSVWAWGKNDVGQLGDGTKTSKTTAVQVVELSGVISVAAGSQHSLALKSDGTVWGWGYNSVGQVGNGGTLYQTYSKPEQVKNLTGIIAIAAKANSSYALKNDGTVWSWGNNTNGQLGDNTSTNRSVPVQVVGVSGVSQLAAGSNYAYALKTDGTVWGWGYGSALLGGSGTNSKANLMPGLTGIASIAATSGSSTGLALKKDGSVGGWNSTSFTPVSGLSSIEAIAGGSSNYAMGADGSVWNWTNGAPTKAAGLSDISAIAMGTNYTVFSKTDGSIWSWGSINSDGQLGDGTTVAHTPPALVKENVAPKVTLTYPVGTKGAPEETNVSNPSIRWTQDDAALTNFSAYEVQVLDASGTVVVDSGVVDQPVTSVANAWTVTQLLPAGQAFQVRVKVYDEQLWSEWSAMGWLKVKDGTQQKQSQLATGDNHTLRVKADGSVWAWGKNDVGQLGDGTKTSKTTAIQVVELSGVISVAAGSQHSLALKSDGTVWGWGNNSVGQVGNGGSVYQTYSKPEQVKNLTGIIAIAAKANSSYALKNDGTVWSWGNNSNGQLGDSSTTNRSVPVQVVGVSGVSQLAAGSNYAYALKTDGTVWGWGYGSALLGGSGTNSKANLMPGLTGIASIAATSGSSTGLALKKDGSVGVWNSTSFTPVSGLSSIEAIAGGSSNYAMGADGSVWNWTNGAPTKAAGLSDISAIAMGTNYTVFSKTDGSIWSWGSINSDGQLGDGTTVAHTLPALVKENVAPKVTLTYPLGTKGAPEETNVSNPSIRWTQDDAALTNFSAYEVQVLDASGTVVVDSGVVDQPVTSVANAWTVTQPLAAGQAFQVRVKVYDEQLWSEWSAMGWLKYTKVLNDVEQQKIKMGINKLKILSGEETTVTLTVYGKDGVIDTNFNGLQKVTISGYLTAQEGEFGHFGGEELVSSGSTSVDINFTQGIAEVSLSLNQIAQYKLLFLLDDLEVGKLELEIVSTEEHEIKFAQLPATLSKEGNFDLPPIIVVIDKNGNLVEGLRVIAKLKRGEGQLSGDISMRTNADGSAIFSDLKINNINSEVELTFYLEDGITYLDTPIINLGKLGAGKSD